MMNRILTNTRLIEPALRGIELLNEEDPELYNLLENEYFRQTNVLTMVASSSIANPSVLACQGMALGNLTTEGYPGARYHAGCKFADVIERLATERAKTAFKAQYVNVQPHSGSTANQIVMFSLLKPGDTILGLELNSGGHLTHGAKASVSGQYFNAIGYGLTEDGYIDYEQVERLAREHRPKLIISGASSYPRIIDFKRLREIADEVGAFMLADISHIAGLIIAGEHPSPIDQAHFTTTSTYKQLYGPRGGLIMMGKDFDKTAPNGKKSLSAMIQHAVFPFFQGTPNLGAIAAKARALAITLTPEFKELASRIVITAKKLAKCFTHKGYKVISGGTDNHIVLLDLLANGVTGVIAERALEECNIIVNRNRIPGDKKAAMVTSGLRLGSNSLAVRAIGDHEIALCVDLIHEVITSLTVIDDSQYLLDEAVRDTICTYIEELCRQFPLPCYPELS